MIASKIMKTVGALACSAALGGVLAGCASSTPAVLSVPATSEGQGITVSASAETKVVPDKARVSVSVVSEDKDAEACRSANAESVDAVLAALAALGVEETSIQTSYSDLSPRYGSRVSSSEGDEAQGDFEDWVITGYDMTTRLTVSDLDIDAVGAAVGACVGAGANGTDGIQFYASSYDEAYNGALADALETAEDKALSIADATGVSLGQVVNVVEGYQDTSARYVESYNLAMEEADDAAFGAASKAMPGQVGITANVTVTYSIS